MSENKVRKFLNDRVQEIHDWFETEVVSEASGKISVNVPDGYSIDYEDSTSNKIVLKEDEKPWVDMGLPSGTLWASQNYSIKNYDANDLKGFGDSLPCVWHFYELIENTKQEYDKIKHGFWIIADNGNRLFFPAIQGYIHGDTYSDNIYRARFWTRSNIKKQPHFTLSGETSVLTSDYIEINNVYSDNKELRVSNSRFSNVSIPVRLIKTR